MRNSLPKPCWFYPLLLAFLLATVSARAEKSPVAILEGMSNQVLELVTKDPGILDDNDRLRSFAYDIVVPNIDFVALSQWVLGKYWRQATAQQRRIFSQEFREVLIRTYLSSIARADYKGQTIRYLPLRKIESDNRVVVEAEIKQPSGPLIKVLFRMYRRDGGADWRVYDVVVEGVSLVATYRSNFSSIIREKGLDGLITMLEDHNTWESPKPAAGSPATASQ